MSECLIVRVQGASNFEPGKSNYVTIESGGKKFSTVPVPQPSWSDVLEIPSDATDIKFVLFKDNHAVGGLTFKTDSLLQKILNPGFSDSAKRYKLQNSEIVIEIQFSLGVSKKSRTKSKGVEPVNTQRRKSKHIRSSGSDTQSEKNGISAEKPKVRKTKSSESMQVQDSGKKEKKAG